MKPKVYPKVLTIAGSDSGGGAGIQADLKTIAAHHCYGLSVVTALTAQNTEEVKGIHEVPPAFVVEQLEAVLDDIGCDAVKTGMLASAEIISAVAKTLKNYDIPNLVVDPVMISKTGQKLLKDDAIGALVEELIPQARLVTPNTDEAGVILGKTPRNVTELRAAAEELGRRFGVGVLMKGGHLTTDPLSTDVLWYEGQSRVFHTERLNAVHTHGTGCTLSSAIACELARGGSIEQAVHDAKDYLTEAMKMAWPLGHGIGPVNHLWNVKVQLFH